MARYLGDEVGWDVDGGGLLAGVVARLLDRAVDQRRLVGAAEGVPQRVLVRDDFGDVVLGQLRLQPVDEPLPSDGSRIVQVTDSPENKLSKSWSPSGDKSRRWVMGRAREALQPRVRDQEGGHRLVPERLDVGEGGLVALGAALPLLGRQGEVLDRGCVERVEVLVHRAEALDPSVGVDYFATKLFNSVLLSSMNHMSPGMLEGHRTEQLPVRATPSAARRTLVPM